MRGLAMLVLVGVLVGLSVAAASLPAVAATGTSTSVTLAIDPSGPVGIYTPVTFTGKVSPAPASGRVTFIANGKGIGVGEVIGGVATITSSYHDLGSLSVTARFDPDNGTPYVTSTSGPVTLLVEPEPAIWLYTLDGHAVPPDAKVEVTSSVVVQIAGFHPGTPVELTMGHIPLHASIRADGSGAGSATVTVPDVGSSVYLFMAAGDSVTATFDIYIYNPRGAVTPTPTPTSTTTAPIVVTIPASGTPTPTPTSSGTLPKTGADTTPTAGSALMLLVTGVLLVLLGRPVVRSRARHARASGSRGRRRSVTDR